MQRKIKEVMGHQANPSDDRFMNNDFSEGRTCKDWGSETVGVQR